MSVVVAPKNGINDRVLPRRRRTTLELLLLATLCAALYLPGLAAIPPVDRDEALYVQATRQMLAGGDFVVPRVGDDARLIKPAGIYWLQAASARLASGFAASSASAPPELPSPAGPAGPAGALAAAGVAAVSGPSGMFAHRLPSALGAVAAVAGTWAIGRRLLAPPAALLGAALLAASSLLVVEAHLATTDAVLLACAVAAQGCLATLLAACRHGRRGKARTAAAFWLAQAAGMLIKGPVAPLVSGLTVAALAFTGSRRERAAGRALLAALRPAWGFPLAIACLLPWLLALGGRVGWQALPAAMAGDIFPKLGGAHESHGGPPGLYLLLSPLTFWPGSVVLAFAIAHGWRRRQRPAERFLLAWLLPAWLFFECLPTKLPHYVLPAFPALALLAGRGILRAAARLRPPPRHALVRAAWVGWALIPVGFAGAVAVAAWRLDATAPVRAWAAFSVLVACATSAVCLRYCRRSELASAAVSGIAGAALLYAVVLQAILPRLDGLWLSRRIAAALTQVGSSGPVLAVGYTEPSLMLFLEPAPGVRTADPTSAARALAAQPGRRAAVAATKSAEFVAAARERAGAGGLAPRRYAVVEGLDYTHGRWLAIELYGSAAADGPR